MTDPTRRPDVNTLSYEQARDELIQVVASLENGSASLEDSLALWERGEALADRCQGWLDAAKERLAAAGADHAAEPDANGTDAAQSSAPGAEEGDQ
ncbi:exodeoxyribonuclease VII small subunit [Pseudactinotalea sp. Z1748]|uniref:exodeoxyribonuclease VII small subunit n=1 Tax=Pseudactinotalea sp. Z1748 TaxID=3413027 RepID=UPI003C7E9627